ncbi:MAG: transcriptional regulator [Rhodobacterales bacterium]|nr:MAG: transcriptional regulator [Rhodobacterales bacterium]
MPKTALTGSRIREWRLQRGKRQAELAKAVGISASYLNLIEHNRRRIGGKLLLDLAEQLGVEPSLLSEGAEAALVARLREAALRWKENGNASHELGAEEEFAGRYPGWAQVLVDLQGRVTTLEHSVETLTDRLAHDPHLAATLHEVLSTVTAIRATAGILVDTREIEPEWRDRFHRNINEDALRLAEGAEELVGYLDGAQDAASEISSPLEESEAFLEANGFHLPQLESEAPNIEAVIRASGDLKSAAGRATARKMLERYVEDARKLPADLFRKALDTHGANPALLAVELGVDMTVVMRRLAFQPELAIGLVICDASGTVVFRRPVEGFAQPRFGAACAKWPLFRALSRPMTPLLEWVEQIDRGGARHQFVAFALATPRALGAFNRDPQYESHMLILPAEMVHELALDEAGQGGEPLPVGSSCRICPQPACDARREPSILAEGV